MFDQELEEFLEADTSPVAVDPGFRARLRERLWEVVRVQAAKRRREGSEPAAEEPDSSPPADVDRRPRDD